MVSNTTKPPTWRRFLGWFWRHPWLTIILIFLAGFVLLNVLAFLHASALLNYSTNSVRTPRPEQLSFGQKLKVLVSGVTVPRPSNVGSPAELGIASEVIHQTAEDGCRLEAWLLLPPNPRGTVVLFHGYAASRSSLLEQGRVYYKLGWATLLVDFRGSGGSDGSATSLGIHEAKDVTAMLRFVRDRGLPKPYVLYGQSMGAAAILRSIATQDVHPDAIILEAVFSRMYDTVRNRFTLMGVPSFPTAGLLVFWGGVQMGGSGFDHNPVEYARVLECPTLMLHGDADKAAKLEEARTVFENIKGNKELVIIPGAGHEPLFPVDSQRWTNAVSGFLSKQIKQAPNTNR